MGHVVLGVQVDQSRSTDNKVVVNVFGAYAHENTQTSGDIDSQFETMTFTRTTIEDSKGNLRSAWVSSHNNYVLFGIGRVKQSESNLSDGNVETSKIKEEAASVP